MRDTATTFVEADNCFVISAYDSVVGHTCAAREGGRVELPVLFDGSGCYTVCPYCHQSV